MIPSTNKNPTRKARAETRSRRGEKYVGKPCVHGHDGVRYLSSGGCVTCIQLAMERLRAQYKARGEVYDPHKVHAHG